MISRIANHLDKIFERYSNKKGLVILDKKYYNGKRMELLQKIIAV